MAAIPPHEALSVSEFTQALRDVLTEGFAEVWVRGEVSQPRRVASGHLYLTLKDEGAVCPAVMWRSQVARLRHPLEEGDEVLALGSVDVYPPHGRYQLILREIHPLGLGALQRQFEALRRRLEAEGLFDAARKQPLPALPRRIALVTSRTGAAVRDLVTVIQRRFPAATLLLRSVRVQGDGAAAEIAAALAWVDLHSQADVIIVGRGGGSLEDLWAFNEEVVARAIAACTIPIISAVGHEHDVTIADLVADVRAATPSQAGELVVPVREDLLAQLARDGQRLARGLRVRVDQAWQRLEALADRPVLRDAARWLGPRRLEVQALAQRLRARSPLAVLRRQAERVSELSLRLALPLRRRLEQAGDQLNGVATTLERAGQRRLERTREQLLRLEQSLEALSPTAVLHRGYSLTTLADGRVLRRAQEVAPGERLLTHLADGKVKSVVERVEPEQVS